MVLYQSRARSRVPHRYWESLSCLRGHADLNMRLNRGQDLRAGSEIAEAIHRLSPSLLVRAKCAREPTSQLFDA